MKQNGHFNIMEENKNMLRLPDKKYFKLTKYAYYFQKLTLF